MKVFFTVSLFLFLPFLGKGQMFFFSDTSTVFGFPNTPAIGIYDMSNCSIVEKMPFSPIRFTDLTVHQNGNLYGFGEDITTGSTGQQWMCRITWPVAGIFSLTEYYQDSIRAMTCGQDSLIYAAGNGLSTFDIVTEEFTYIGDFPTGLQAEGDIAFFNGQLLMTSISNSLVSVDIANPQNSSVFLDFPSDTPPVHGLVVYNITCDSTLLYAIANDDDVQKIYRVDFSTGDLIEICDTGLFIEGAAAVDECLMPECQVSLDLDSDDSSLAIQNDFYADTVCSATVPIADVDVMIDTDLPFLDSIKIELVGAVDGSDEYLLSNGAFGINVIGSATSEVLLVNNGNADIGNFKDALLNTFYNNISATPSFGLRQVLVNVWGEDISSDTAIAHILLENTLQAPTSNIIDVICYGEEDGQITIQGMGGNPPYSYSWNNGMQGSTASALNTGIYTVTVTDIGGCEKVDSFEVNEPDSLSVWIDYSGPLETCSEDEMAVANTIGGTLPYTYSWNNGITDPVNENIGAGLHEVIVTDSNGCTGNAFLDIGFGDTVLVLENWAMCGGETFEWQGNTYSRDTLVCEIYELPDGCDSSICLSLSVNSSPLITISADNKEINIGESVTLNASTNVPNPSVTWWPPRSSGLSRLSCYRCNTTYYYPI